MFVDVVLVVVFCCCRMIYVELAGARWFAPDLYFEFG